MSALEFVTFGTLLAAVGIPGWVWWVGRRHVDRSDDAKDRRRARALPLIGEGVIPADRDLTVAQDTGRFSAIVRLLLRSWPYIRPQILGHWWLPGRGLAPGVADTGATGGWGLAYAPILLIGAVITGPLLGWVPPTFAYPYHFLYLALLVMVVAMSALALMPLGARWQAGLAIALALAGFTANLMAALVIEGSLDSAYVALVTLAAIVGWMVQLRRHEGRWQYRVRVQAHLVYLYLLIGIQGFIALTMGLVIADLLNQSLLQNQPAMPALAAFFGHPEWGRGELAVLTEAQRQEMKWWHVKLGLALWLISLPISVIRPIYHVWIMQRINQDLRLALVERWHQLSMSYHSNHRTGDSIYRIYQDSAQVTAVIGQLSELLTTCFYFLLALALLAFLSPTMGLLAATIVLPALLWARWAMPRMRTRSLVYRAATSDVTSRVQESFAAIRLIKAYGAEERTQVALENDSIVAFNAAFRVRVLIALVTIVMFTISAVFLLGGEFWMAMAANQGRATFANELIAVMGFSFVVWNLGAFNWAKEKLHETTGSVRGIMRQWLTAQDMAMGLSRVFDILDIEPGVENRTDAIPFSGFEREIRFADVAFQYEPGRTVLDGVSFAASPGTITAIVGPTGSGKSTLMGLLLRLYDPVRGSITVDGHELAAFDVASLRANVAIALQENVLFALSIRDNIRYVAPDATDAAVDRAIEVACMDDYVNTLPDGLDTVLGDRGGKLSTGQRQRLSIARAVVRDTSILILDEPTAALDAATEHQVMTRLAVWGAGRAIFLITHRISTIRRADNILYLDGGRIVESGDHDALMRRTHGRYRAFVVAESNLSADRSEVQAAPRDLEDGHD